MSQFFTIHPGNPQLRLVRQAVEIIRGGGVIVCPTDSCYALGCHVGDKAAMERIRAIRGSMHATISGCSAATLRRPQCMRASTTGSSG